MNFVSHFYCLKKDHPYYTFGALVPDIFDRFSYFHNKFFKYLDLKEFTENETFLLGGIEQHHEDDKFFHEMPLFKHFMKRIEEEMALREHLKNIKRKFLVSHVLYELILDNMIVTRFPHLVTKIYSHFEEIDSKLIKSFFEKIIGKNHEIDLFLISLQRFMEKRYLNFYSKEVSLVKALQFVTGKIGDWEMTNNTIKEFLEVINLIKEETNFESTFESIKTHKLSQ